MYGRRQSDWVEPELPPPPVARGKTIAQPRPDTPDPAPQGEPQQEPSKRQRKRRRRWRSGSIRRYTWFVRISKGVLPLIAAGLMATVAAWPYLQESDAFPLPIASWSEVAIDLKLVGPEFTGVDRYDRPYMLTAKEARQARDDPELVTLSQPQGDITLQDQSWITLSAETGSFYKDMEILDLAGSVNLFHDDGYEFRTLSAQFDMQTGVASGDERIEGQGPFGRVEAEGFRIKGNGTVVQFVGKSRLVIYPKSDVMADAGKPNG